MNTPRTHLIFATALLFIAQPTRAAVTEAWVQRYNNVVTNSNYRPSRIARDAAGDIIVVGTLYGYQMHTIKYSGADGSVLWFRRFDGSLYRDDDGDNPYDPDVAVDGTGNVVVAVASGTGFRNRGYYTAKYAAADGALLWERRYNGPANSDDAALAVAVDARGNVVVTGFSSGTNSYIACYTVMYTAADGALIWERRQDVPVSSGSQLAVDTEGNVVVAFTAIGTNGFGYPWDSFIAKYAASDGALLWEKRYDNPTDHWDVLSDIAVDASGNVAVTGTSRTFKYGAADGAVLWETGGGSAVAIDSSGNVVVGGATYGTNGFSDFLTAKYAGKNGMLLWEQSYNSPANGEDFSRAVSTDNGGNVLVTGVSYPFDPLGDYHDPTNWTLKYAANGELLWQQHYSSGADLAFAQHMVADANGNAVVTGYFYSGASGYDYYMAKYAPPDGALLWEQHDTGLLANLPDEPRAVAVDASGNVVVTGTSSNGRNTDYYTAKYAANGTLLWAKRRDSGGHDDANALALDADGNVVVTGGFDTGRIFILSGTIFGGETSDYYTAKYAAADGALLWEKRYNSPTNNYDEALAVAVDGSGNVIVTGYSRNLSLDSDSYTAKYAATDGTLIWERRQNVRVGGGSHLALDTSGNVVVAGSSWNGISSDYYTAKYAAADGALLWERRYNGPANGDDYALSVTVDGSGNVVVTGFSYKGLDSFGNRNDDLYTAKYAASNGALLWEKRYDGPDSYSRDNGSAVAVDSSGDVVVTGTSSSLNSSTDYYTAKYSAADGTLLWEKRYAGPGLSGDDGQAVAVDSGGDVLVTGKSQGDFYTAKYAGADGALIWEQRFKAAGGSSFAPVALALGPNGMVAITGPSSSDYATVVYREPLPPVSIGIVPTGVRLRFAGIAGRSYGIERAPSVSGPWSTLSSPTAPPNGLIEYVDTNATPGSAFYRTATVP